MASNAHDSGHAVEVRHRRQGVGAEEHQVGRAARFDGAGCAGCPEDFRCAQRGHLEYAQWAKPRFGEQVEFPVERRAGDDLPRPDCIGSRQQPYALFVQNFSVHSLTYRRLGSVSYRSEPATQNLTEDVSDS